MTEEYVDVIYSYMNIFLKKIVDQYRDYPNTVDMGETCTLTNKIPVWVLWWQGVENAPEVVKLCINSMKRNLPDCAKLILLDSSNYKNYIELPDIVNQRFEEGVLDIVHFTDVLRVNLLCKYGGMWLDSTYFIANKLDDDFFQKNTFFTQRYGYIEVPGGTNISKGRWATNIMYGKVDNILFHFIKDSWKFYLERHTNIWDYYLIDYIIAVGYENVPEIRKLIESCQPNNLHAGDLQSLYGNQELDLDWYHTLIGDTTFYKMTYKAPLKHATDEGVQTLYGYICEKYGIEL